MVQMDINYCIATRIANIVVHVPPQGMGLRVGSSPFALARPELHCGSARGSHMSMRSPRAMHEQGKGS